MISANVAKNAHGGVHWRRLYFGNRNVNELTFAASSSPATDHTFDTRAPMTQCPGMVKTTAFGPSRYLLVLKRLPPSGSPMEGPMPQMTLPGLAGLRKP